MVKMKDYLKHPERYEDPMREWVISPRYPLHVDVRCRVCGYKGNMIFVSRKNPTGREWDKILKCPNCDKEGKRRSPKIVEVYGKVVDKNEIGLPG
jgi:hypothetical protein